MSSSNWIELAALVLTVTTGLVLWRVCAKKLRRQDGFEGIIEERGQPPVRRQMDAEEEIEYLEDILDE